MKNVLTSGPELFFNTTIAVIYINMLYVMYMTSENNSTVCISVCLNNGKGSLTVWALYAYFSDSQNTAFELLVWCM